MASSSIVIMNDLKELQRLNAFIGSLAEALSLDEYTLFQINLACDELVTNTISYGYPQEEAGMHTIRIDVGLVPDGWELRITDRGVPFNPLLNPSPSVDCSLDERGIGGFGIHFVRQVMDEIRYERLYDENIVMMKKRRAQEEEMA
ncbi:ATP-binding protein [Paenibacillus sp. SI8]|uniref:ATP-binding protein n=1 Tax=unclassified Paenibacillus TaxID=185978 RepID=UPI003466EA5C